MSSFNSSELENLPPGASLRTVLLVGGALVTGALFAAIWLPAWLPDLRLSLLGSTPQAYWFLSRGSALVAYLLLWGSMVFGVLLTNKMARLWPGGPTAYGLHEFTSLLGMGFGLFHAVILIGDRYIDYTVAQIVVPFASTGYKPFWVGLGQLGLYLLALENFSFYVRQRIGTRAWRLIHYASFLTFLLALIHGLLSGTDTTQAWVAGMYWLTGGSLLFLSIFRLLTALMKRIFPEKSATVRQRV